MNLTKEEVSEIQAKEPRMDARIRRSEIDDLCGDWLEQHAEIEKLEAQLSAAEKAIDSFVENTKAARRRKERDLWPFDRILEKYAKYEKLKAGDAGTIND